MLTSYDIPKKLHLYWGKNDNLSKLHFLTVKSFLKHHPEWEISVWYDSHYQEQKNWVTAENKLPYIGKNYFDDLHTIKQVSIRDICSTGIQINHQLPEVKKSDIFRYYIIYKEGGVYSDFDILYLKSIQNLLNTFISNDKDKLLINWQVDYLSIGFFAGNKGNLFFKYLYDLCLLTKDHSDYQAFGTNMIIKYLKNFKEVQKIFTNIEILNFNSSIMYPFSWKEIDLIFTGDNTSKVTESTLGVHWFNGSDFAKNYLNNPNNYCTISKLIEKIDENYD